jgi:hypothetical protein
MEFAEKLFNQLMKEPNFVSDNGELKKWVVISKARNYDAELIGLLLDDKELKAKFFIAIKSVLVFNQTLFVQFLEQKNFLNGLSHLGILNSPRQQNPGLMATLPRHNLRQSKHRQAHRRFRRNSVYTAAMPSVRIVRSSAAAVESSADLNFGLPFLPAVRAEIDFLGFEPVSTSGAKVVLHGAG